MVSPKRKLPPAPTLSGERTVSCNDSFRPVSFYLETLEEDAD